MKRYVKFSAFQNSNAKQIADELSYLGKQVGPDAGNYYSDYCNELLNIVTKGDLTVQSTHGRLVIFDQGQLGVIALGATDDRCVGIARHYQGYARQRYRYTLYFQNVDAYTWSTSSKEVAYKWARDYLAGKVDDQLRYINQ